MEADVSIRPEFSTTVCAIGRSFPPADLFCSEFVKKREGVLSTICRGGAMDFRRACLYVLLLLLLLLSLMTVRCSATVVLIGKNVSLSLDDVEANFSPSIKSSGISGTVYVSDPLDACSPLTNKVEEGTNSFALIIRGECPFDEKVMAAQKAGFNVAIVYDNIDGSPLVSMAGSPVGVRINAIFVSKASGEVLKEFAGRADVDFWIIPTFESSAWSIMAISLISLLAMSAVLATCFFVRRHRIRRDRPRGPNSNEFHGMSKESVKEMPSLLFTTALEDNCTSRTCAICLEDYNVGELIRILPCRHKFHAECVDSWLTTWRTFCPVCKRDAQTMPAAPLPSESTPLLSISSLPSSSFHQPFPSPSPSQAIQITPSPSPSSIPRHPNSYRRRHLCHSPAAATAAAMSRSSFSHRSMASLGLHHSASINSFSVRGSSIGSPSYLAGSSSHRRQSFLLQNSPSAATLSAASLPDC